MAIDVVALTTAKPPIAIAIRRSRGLRRGVTVSRAAVGVSTVAASVISWRRRSATNSAARLDRSGLAEAG